MNSLCLCILVIVNIINISALQCKNENNIDVDWFVMYKIPHNKKGSNNNLIKRGLAYLYITSENNDIEANWILSNKSVNDTQSLLAYTLSALYTQENIENLVYILYNDEPPNKSQKGSKGHTKGVVLGDENGGIWLVHSVPLFPPAASETYSYPFTGTIYGQSVLCISLDVDNFNNIGTQLQYNEPEIYSSNIPINLTYKYAKLNAVINRDTIINPPWFHTLNITSNQGTNFISFAKTKSFAKDLYFDWVAPSLNTTLLVETWPNGPGRLPSNCTKQYSVKNIRSINLKAADFTFKSTLDHSKWAVSNNTQTNWICIGDINRAEHQEVRGGGTVCSNYAKLAHLYLNCINDVENCK